MTRDEFADAFRSAIMDSIGLARKNTGGRVPERFKIEFHGFGQNGKTLEIDEALELLYVGPDRYLKVIDVSVVRIMPSYCVVFVRPSGHAPGPFQDTWNQPPGSGPFKQLICESIQIVPE